METESRFAKELGKSAPGCSVATKFLTSRAEHPHGWDINDRDIAAQTEAILRIAGPQHAVGSVRQWRPKSIALRVATILSCKLITMGEAPLVERCLTEALITTPWDIVPPYPACTRWQGCRCSSSGSRLGEPASSWADPS